MDYDKMVADFEAIYDRIVPMIQETTHLVNEALDEDKTVLSKVHRQLCLILTMEHIHM